jgi:hypothetical protein
MRTSAISDEPVQASRYKRSINLVFLTNFIDMMGFGLLLPILPYYYVHLEPASARNNPDSEVRTHPHEWREKVASCVFPPPRGSLFRRRGGGGKESCHIGKERNDKIAVGPTQFHAFF